MPAEPAVDLTRCPLCGQPNQCAGQLERETGVPQPPCWCTQRVFGEDLLQRVPEALRRQVCICAACAGGAREASAKL